MSSNENTDVQNFVELLKMIPYKALYSVPYIITILSGLLLFLKNDALKAVGLLNFKTEIDKIVKIEIVFSVSLILSLALLFYWIYQKCTNGNSKPRIKQLKALSANQKQLLHYMYNHQDETTHLSTIIPSISDLKKKGIITAINETPLWNPADLIYPYHLSEKTINILKNNPKLLTDVPDELPEIFKDPFGTNSIQ